MISLSVIILSLIEGLIALLVAFIISYFGGIEVNFISLFILCSIGAWIGLNFHAYCLNKGSEKYRLISSLSVFPLLTFWAYSMTSNIFEGISIVVCGVCVSYLMEYKFGKSTWVI